MGITTFALTFAAVLIGALASATGVLARRSPTPRTTRAIAGAAAAGIVTTMAALVFFRSNGIDAFGAMHLLYLVGVVAIPIVGATFATTGARQRNVALGVIDTLLVTPAPVGWYATHVEPYRLRTETVQVAMPERSGSGRLRIAVLADLQTNRVSTHERDAIARVNASKPDLILIPGDLFQGSGRDYERALPELQRLVRALDAPGGVFFVRGDVDGGGRANAILDGSGVRILDDEIVEFRVRDRTVVLGGNRLEYATAEAKAVRAQLAERNGDNEAIRILMAHRPDAALDLPRDSRVDLVVAGHTHGGQVVMPFFGPLLTLSDVPRHIARGGLHELSGNRIVVSPGVGLERNQAPQVRFLRPPAVVIVDITT